MTATELRRLLRKLNDDLPADLDEQEQGALLQECQRLQHKLESPFDATIRTLIAPQNAAYLRIALDLGLFDLAAASGGTITVTKAADSSRADPILLQRILRSLSSFGAFTETAQDTYQMQSSAFAWVKGSPLRDMIIQISSTAPVFARLPSFLASTNYRNPSDAYNSPWQYGHDTKLHYFDWLSQNPEYESAFHTIVTLLPDAEPWYKYYPLTTALQNHNASDTSPPFLIELGGSTGKQILALHSTLPDLKLKLILQDLPSVISSITPSTLPPSITAIPHDFFNPQPSSSKNATFFLLRKILHDWPDTQACVILGHIRDVMGPGSRLLVNEVIMPETKVDARLVNTDAQLMIFSAGMDRTRGQWGELLGSVGLEVEGVFEGGAEDGMGLIVAVMKGEGEGEALR